MPLKGGAWREASMALLAQALACDAGVKPTDADAKELQELQQTPKAVAGARDDGIGAFTTRISSLPWRRKRVATGTSSTAVGTSNVDVMVATAAPAGADADESMASEDESMAPAVMPSVRRYGQLSRDDLDEATVPLSPHKRASTPVHAFERAKSYSCAI